MSIVLSWIHFALSFFILYIAPYLLLIVCSSIHLRHSHNTNASRTWVHRHLQACNFVFDPGWRRLHRQWCIHQLFAGRFQDDGAYHKWRVHLWRRRAVRVCRRRRRRPTFKDGKRKLVTERMLNQEVRVGSRVQRAKTARGQRARARGWSEISQHRRFSSK